MNKELMFSSKTDLWETPQELFDKLNQEFHFTLDVCRKREGTPCEGCDFKKHFKWRGLGNESKTAEQALKERS